MSIYIFSSNWCFTAQGWPYWSSESLASQDRPVPLLVTEVGCLLGMAREQILGLIEDGGPPKNAIFWRGMMTTPLDFGQFPEFSDKTTSIRCVYFSGKIDIGKHGFDHPTSSDYEGDSCIFVLTSIHFWTCGINKMGGIHPQNPMADDHFHFFHHHCNFFSRYTV